MYLENLYIHGFGCLRTEVRFDSDRMNLAVADNEMGKSTLISAILAAFYGIVEDERATRDKRPRRKNVLPWSDPENFGIRLDFTMDTTHWQIERDFNNGQVHLIDRDSGKDHAADYHKGRGVYHIGEELIGLSCADFLKSFYMKQEEILEIRDAGGLTPHVQRVATAREGGATSENAIERLRSALRNYPFPGSRDGITIENALKRLNSTRDGLLSELEDLTRKKAEVEPLGVKLSETINRIETLKDERDKSKLFGDLAEIRELENLVDKQNSLRKEFDERSAAADDLKEFEDFPASKGDQLIKLAGRVEELSTAVKNQREKLEVEISTNLARIEENLQAHSDLAGVTETDLREFESSSSRFSDRHARLVSAEKDVAERQKRLKEAGVDRQKFDSLKETFTNLSGEDRHFIEGFRATYAEEEAIYREAKARREWIEKDRNSILDRLQRIISTARLFFITAAVLALAGGTLILMTQGDWKSQVLVGLGIIFGSVGAFIRGTAGSSDKTRLSVLEEDLADITYEEDESRKKLDSVGRNLTDIAVRLEFSDGNELLSEYLEYDRMYELAEPLIQAERDAEKAKAEYEELKDGIQPFFDRAGETVPEVDNVLESLKDLLGRYREVVKLGEEYKTVKLRKDDLENECKRLERDLESNSQLCTEILILGGIDETIPLEEAVEKFREALGKHREYKSIVDDKLPMLKRDLLPEVDMEAKTERIKMLKEKSADVQDDGNVVHTKEFYREQADKVSRSVEQLSEERQQIYRSIGTAYDNYSAHQPELMRQISDLEDETERADFFKSEIETSLCIMEDISREVYKSWAAALSEEAAPFLENLNPRYEKLQFDEDLSFTIRDRNFDRTLTSSEIDNVLSSGARDEVFLAARLGISAYLAKGVKGSMPIVLDEPLSSADDDKFLSGMRFFLDVLSRNHQVLIMSCHEERHRWLRDQMKNLFDERVHIIALTSAENVGEK